MKQQSTTQHDAHVLEMQINDEGIFEFNGELIQQAQQSQQSEGTEPFEQAEHSTDSRQAIHESLFTETNPLQFADGLRAANERYLATMRQRFETTRRSMMEQMAAMKSSHKVPF